MVGYVNDAAVLFNARPLRSSPLLVEVRRTDVDLLILILLHPLTFLCIERNYGTAVASFSIAANHPFTEKATSAYVSHTTRCYLEISTQSGKQYNCILVQS